MNAAPYWIELQGGRFDGYCRGCAVAPSQTCLELSSNCVSARPSDATRTAVYELAKVTIETRQGAPAMVYHFVHTKTTVCPNGRWWTRLLSTVRRRMPVSHSGT